MDLVEAVKEAGVVGAGGAGFPTHLKISANVDTVLANGAECEPLLYSDLFVMTVKAEDVVEGLRLVMKSTGADKGLICVKEKNSEAIKIFQKLIAKNKNISIFLLGNFYPSGDEQILVYEATGRIVPEGGIPLAVGVVVQNVGTLAQIAEASKGLPVTDRVVTVTGEIKKAGVYTVPIGTRVADLITLCGGSLLEEYAVLLNGPMMGRLINPNEEVITKTSGGVILLPKDHSYVYRMSRSLEADIRMTKGACEQCRYCTDFCPRYLQGHSLEPHKIMRVMSEDLNPQTATVARSFLCCECGVCDLFACPITLSPRRFFQEFKRKLGGYGVKNQHSNKPEKVDIYRDYRRVPKEKLTRMLGLSKYEAKPPFIKDCMLVNSVDIPLQMHIGAPAKAVVKEGKKIKKGDLIAEIDGKKLGARIHASISGVVESVNGSVRIAR